jgi:hypothetical protein
MTGYAPTFPRNIRTVPRGSIAVTTVSPTMADVPGKRLLESHVFGEALILLVQWKGGADEPTVLLDGQLLRISVVFSRVANLRCADTLPRGMRDLLLAYGQKDASRHTELTALMLTPTYETAARCLSRWFNEKFVPPPRR